MRGYEMRCIWDEIYDVLRREDEMTKLAWSRCWQAHNLYWRLHDGLWWTGEVEKTCREME